MARITIDYPDAVGPRITNAFAGQLDYASKVDDGNGNLITNPETKAQFTKRMIQEYIMSVVTAYESNEAAQTARKTAQDKVRSEITLT